MKILDIEHINKDEIKNMICFHCGGKAYYRIKYVFEDYEDEHFSVYDKFYLCKDCLIEWKKKFKNV